jgi:Ca2+-binding RTX toxin-like protein
VGEGEDTLCGGQDDDLLLGGKQNDILCGGQGNDFLSGDCGNDMITTGSGEDTISLFYGADSKNLTIEEVFGFDTLTDFDATQDQIILDKNLFGDIQVTEDGQLATGEFIKVQNFDPNTVGDAHLIYDETNRTLYYLDDQGQAHQLLLLENTDNLDDFNGDDFQLL